MGREAKASDRFASQAGWLSQHALGQLLHGQSEGFPKGNVLCPLCATRSRAGEDAGGVPQASSDHDEFLFGIGREGAQGLLAPVLQNQGNRLAKARQTFFTRFSLSVSTRDFGAIRDVPWAVLFDDRRELVVHSSILTPIDRCNARTPTCLAFFAGALGLGFFGFGGWFAFRCRRGCRVRL